MEKNISKKVEEFVRKQPQNNSKIEGFINASKKYDKLVQTGLTVKRGHNVMTTQEIYDQALNCAYVKPIQH